MQSNMSVDHVENTATSQLKGAASRFPIVVRSGKSGVRLPFQHAPVMMTLDQRIGLLSPGGKCPKEIGEMCINGILSIEQFAPGIEQLGVWRIERGQGY